jgi:hypothetical protein
MHHLTNHDVLTLHRNVLRVLEEVGLQIDHPKLLDALAGIGANIDPANSRVRFPRAMVEEFLAGLPKVDWGARRPTLTVRASFFEGFYQDARTGALSNMDAQRVVGSDANGAMYGGLDVAEAIRLGTLAELTNGEHKPFIARRGIKFNIPLDARTPSYSDAGDAAQQNIPEMWSTEFWHSFLDEMARHRFNVLTLWNLHPRARCC